MSAQEFGQWITYFEREQLHPVAGRQRHAQLLAATANGPLQRKDGASWVTSMFMQPDPWAAPAQASEPEQPSPQQIAAQVAALNARMD